MKTKLLAMMLLAGGSMFAQTRFSIGLGFGTQGGEFYQAPPAYAANIPPQKAVDHGGKQRTAYAFTLHPRYRRQPRQMCAVTVQS